MHKTIDIDLLKFSELRTKGPLEQPSLGEVNVLRVSGRSIQPIVVRTILGKSPVQYEIVLGESWWLAAQQAGLHRVDIEVRDDLSDDEVRALLRDSAKRGGECGIMERAHRCAEYLAQKRTQAEVAKQMHLSRTQVAHLVRLLKLAPDVQQLLESGQLKPGPARALVGLPPSRQRYFAREFIVGRMTTQAIEREAASEKKTGRSYVDRESKSATVKKLHAASPALRRGPHPDPDIARMEEQIGESTGLVAEIHWDPAAHKGMAVFSFSSLDEFDGLLSRLGVFPD